MLELSDPLWCKLNSAYGFGKDIPLRLHALATQWDENDARELMYGDLIHQETCYGATYAAAPHLLQIALSDKNVRQRMDIAIFLGHCVLCAFGRVDGGLRPASGLNGLATTLESWEQTRDSYRWMLDRGAERQMVADCREIVGLEPPTGSELQKFVAIRDEFIALLPAIRSVCELAFHEHAGDEHIPGYLLSGLAATERLTELAGLLESGEDGCFTCRACSAEIDYIVIGDSMALYFQTNESEVAGVQNADRALLDWQDGAARRADSLVIAFDDQNDESTPSVDKLITLAQQAENPKLESLLRNFLGKFTCSQCGETCQVCSDIPR
jgi:hypothetical protein